MALSGVRVNDECLTAFEELRLGRGASKYIIFKISDDQRSIVVEDKSKETDYEEFRHKLVGVPDSENKEDQRPPRYAAYDVEYELAAGEGKRSKIALIAYIPTNISVKSKMIYSTSFKALQDSLNGWAKAIQANEGEELEWKAVLDEVSGGKAKA